MIKAKDVERELRKVSDIDRAKNSAWFFKTGKGQYGYGDKFLGVRVPDQRKVAKKYFEDISFAELKKLLSSKFHECRFTALEILVFKFEKGVAGSKEFYLKNLRSVNNWDLVDTSAYRILGQSLLDKKDRSVLKKLALSDDLWENRIAIVSTYSFIKRDDFRYTLKISEILLKHPHDLIHKAVGWMLREVGNRNLKIEENFLKKHYKNMPRTMLRYAIERFPEAKRKRYLRGTI